jgi:hypothetical protein
MKCVDSGFKFGNLRQAHLYREEVDLERTRVDSKMRDLLNTYKRQYAHARPPVWLVKYTKGILFWRLRSDSPTKQTIIDLFSHPEILDDLPESVYLDYQNYEAQRIELNFAYKSLSNTLTLIDEWIERTRRLRDNGSKFSRSEMA